MPFNIIAVVVAALIPMTLGFIWYHPKTPMGSAWMKLTEMTDEKMKSSNMALIFGVSLLLSFLLAFAVTTNVIHQMGLGSLMDGQAEGSDILVQGTAFMDLTKDLFRTFGHGALHGTLMGLFIALPVMATNAMFERKPWKLTWINIGYWTICLALMGGSICAWR